MPTTFMNFFLLVTHMAHAEYLISIYGTASECATDTPLYTDRGYVADECQMMPGAVKDIWNIPSSYNVYVGARELGNTGLNARVCANDYYNTCTTLMGLSTTSPNCMVVTKNACTASQRSTRAGPAWLPLV